MIQVCWVTLRVGVEVGVRVGVGESQPNDKVKYEDAKI